jgi:(2S)-methylsuccinyl-CoA dehydrogenase
VTNPSTFVNHLRSVAIPAREYAAAATRAVAQLCAPDGRAEAELLQRHQRALHGLAWIATTVEAIQCAAQWSERLAQRGRLGLGEELALTIGVGEYLAQLIGGVPMSQNEIFRPAEIELEAAASALRSYDSVRWFLSRGALPETRRALVAHLREGRDIAQTSFDEDLDLIRDQYRRFAANEITPHAHGWHLADELIPDALVGQLAELGTFGICIGTEYGGLGMGKRAMCIVTEELSRAWIATGSLGTRSEIAGELIGSAGTPEQKAYWLPKLACGEVLPTGRR